MHILMMTQQVDAEHDVLGFTVDWIRALASHVDRLDVLTGYAGSYDLPDNVSVRSYGKERDFGKIRRIATFQRHCVQYAQMDIDAVFVHMIPAYVIASWPWFAASDTPFVLWYAHSETDAKLRVAHRLVDKVVTATNASFRLDSGKLEVLGHGIDTSTFTPGHPETERNLLLGVGRLDPVKNFETLIDAVDELDSRGRDVRLRIVGETSDYEGYEADLRNRIKQLDIESRVTFVGTVPHDEIVAEYRRAEAFLNASRTGSLDKTEVESMACQTPTISSNDSYCEMIRNSELDESLLTFPSGEVTALADRIEALHGVDTTTYRGFGEASRSLARDRHDVRALMKKLVTVIEGVQSRTATTQV